MKLQLFVFFSFIFNQTFALADSDDIERFRKIRREELKNRRPEDIGNHRSVIHSGMRISSPRLNGNGCREGEAEVVLTDDKRTMSILFNSYVVEAGQSYGKMRDMKSCNILVPVSVPAGHRVAVIGLDYRGFVAVPEGGAAQLQTNYQFYNQQKQPISRRVVRNETFVGPLDEDYILTTNLRGRMNWSRCGANLVLKIETDLLARTNQSGDDTLGTLDSIDGQSSEDLTYHLLWEKCQDEVGPGKKLGPFSQTGHGAIKVHKFN